MATMNMKELKEISTKPAAAAGFGNVKMFFESQKSAIASVLPKHLSADRMLRLAIGVLRSNPKLGGASVESLFGAIVQCSQLGLEPNTPLGHAYLIPFENRQKGKTEVQVVFGYKGLIDLSRRSGQILSIQAHEVCENDKFEFAYGLDERLIHEPALKNRGAVVAFYAIAKLQGGGYVFEVMGADQIDEIRDNSQNYKFARSKADTVWGKHYVQMGRKTVLRRLFNYLPVSIELATAIDLDAKADEMKGQDLGAVITGEYEEIQEEIAREVAEEEEYAKAKEGE